MERKVFLITGKFLTTSLNMGICEITSKTPLALDCYQEVEFVYYE